MTAKKKNSDNEQLVRDYLAHNPDFLNKIPIFLKLSIFHTTAVKLFR